MAGKRHLLIADPTRPAFTQAPLFSTSTPTARYNPYPRLISSTDDAREVIRRGCDEGMLGVDLEFNDRGPTILGVACSDTAGAVRWNDELAREAVESVQRSGATIAGHSSIGAEKQQLEKTLGIKTAVSLYDCSMIAHHLVNGDMTKMASKEETDDVGSLGLMGLWTVASLYTSLPHWKSCRGKYCEGPCCRHRVFDYCAVDAWASLAAMGPIKAEMQQLGIPHQFYRDAVELTDICVEMENNGLRVDREWVRTMETRGQEFKDKLFPFELINGKPDYTQFNPKSPAKILQYCKEKNIVLEDTTKADVAKALEKQARREGFMAENIKSLCEVLELAPDISTSLDTLYRLYQFKNTGKGTKSWFDDKYFGKDGRIHPRFITTGTCTGRLSSSRPNLQNLGARGWAKELKKAIIPDDGYDIVESDFSQLELRVILYLAGFDVANIGGDAFNWLVEHSEGSFKKAAVMASMSERDIAKSVSHGCVTRDHEVLTPAGWIPIDTWNGQDIAIWDKTGQITFSQPLRYIQTEADETIELTGTAISQRVTKDHKFPVFSQGTWKGKIYNTWHTRTAETLSKMRLPLCGEHVGQETYNTNDLRRAIAIQADGSACYREGQWRFHLKRPRKIARIQELFGITMTPTPYGTFRGVVTFSSPLLAQNKTLTWEFLNTTPEQKRECITESTLWDGSIGAASRIYSGADTKSMCVLQTLAALSSQQGLWRVDGVGNYPGSTKIVNKLSYNARKYADVGKTEKKTITEKVPVYCFTTESGYFMVRRNNTISVTGNSDYLEGIQVKTYRELESPRIKAEIEAGARAVYLRKYKPRLTRDWEFRGGVVTFTGANLAERLFGDKSLASRRKALEIVEDIYFDKFFAIREWQMKALLQAEGGIIKAPTGRILRLYGTPEDDAKMAVAFLGQGVGADHARAIILKRKREEGTIPLITVHDSVVSQIPKEWSNKMALEFMESMQTETALLPGYRNPGKVKRGTNYGDIEAI